MRNCCIEKRRFSNPVVWQYDASEDMIVDSDWINCYPWMKENEQQFPMMTVAEVNEQTKNQELVNITSPDQNLDVNYFPSAPNICHVQKNDQDIRQEMKLKYQYSDYLIDPNLHCFRDVVKILA